MQSLESLWWQGMETFEIFVYRTVTVVHFTDQYWISKTVYFIQTDTTDFCSSDLSTFDFRRALTHLENKRQLNIRRGKKLGFLLSHRQSPGVWWPVKLVLQTELQKSHFGVRPWSLLTILNFSERGLTDTTVF